MQTTKIDRQYIKQIKQLLETSTRNLKQLGNLVYAWSQQNSEAFTLMNAVCPQITADIWRKFYMVGADKLDARVLQYPCPASRVIEKMLRATQRQVFDNCVVTVVYQQDGAFQSTEKRVTDLTFTEVKTVFSKEGVRTKAEQRDVLAKRVMKRKLRPRYVISPDGMSVRISRDSRFTFTVIDDIRNRMATLVLKSSTRPTQRPRM